MILYFADRKMNILGQASTTLPGGYTITEDQRVEDTDTGVSTFSCRISFDKKSRAELEAMADAGNYLLKNGEGKNEFYTIIDAEIDTKAQEVYIYAEDAGLDLINEIVGEFEASESQSSEWYINKYITDSGFVIGINEIPKSTTRKLKWEGEESVTSRLASIATQFGGYEISYSFDVKNLQIVNKYVNIHKQRGEDAGVTLYLNRDIDRIITSRSVANLVTAFLCEGGVPDNKDKAITFSSEKFSYDDGDFFVDGDKLKSRKANEKWSRYLWAQEPNQVKAGEGYIVKPYSYNTTSASTLCSHAIAELKKVCDMEINYEIDIKKLPEGVRIGDRVNIVDNAGEMYVSTRILQLETSETENKHTATLGDHIIKRSGISQKVTALAEQFAQNAVIVQNALKLADEAQSKANEAAEKVTEANETVEVATKAAEDASAAAQRAAGAVSKVETSVESIKTAVENAQAAAQNASKAAETATSAAAATTPLAQSAVETANSAIATAGEAQSKANEAIGTANAAKGDAAQAKTDVATWAENLETYKQTVTANYARKTELTETQTTLQQQITSNANQLSVVHQNITVLDETANDAKDKAKAAQKVADEATAAANAAQSEADAAKKAAADAQSVVDEAKSNLAQAEADLAAVKTRVDATEGEIEEAEKALAAAQAAVEKAQSDATAAGAAATTAQNKADAAQNAANAAQSAVNALAVRVSQNETAISQSNEAIALRATKKEVEDIQIGGRNLLIGTANGVGWTYDTFGIELRTFVKSNSTTSENYIYCNNEFDLEPGQEYTLSFKAKRNGYLSSMDVYILPKTFATTGIAFNRTGISLSEEYTSIALTFIPNTNATNLNDCCLRFDNNGSTANGTEASLYIKDVKLEKGNKATDWTYAPEDLLDPIIAAQATADQAARNYEQHEAQIQLLADSISNLVRGNEGGTLIRQDENGLYYFDITNIEKNISDVSVNVNELTGIVRDANGDIDVLASTAAALAQRVEYVRSYTDKNGQPCLELGEGDSTFKVRITNTEIQFEEDGVIPAKINRKMLIIEKTIIKGDLQFGDVEGTLPVWIWQRRANGNLGLVRR